MKAVMLLAYLGAAVAEIAGCFAFWAWLRLGKHPAWTLPGLAALVMFALALTRASSLLQQVEHSRRMEVSTLFPR